MGGRVAIPLCCPHSPTNLVAQAGLGALRRIDTRTNEQVTTLDIIRETMQDVLQSPVHRFDSGRRLHLVRLHHRRSDTVCR
jgi:hypothetical protein